MGRLPKSKSSTFLGTSLGSFHVSNCSRKEREIHLIGAALATPAEEPTALGDVGEDLLVEIFKIHIPTFSSYWIF